MRKIASQSRLQTLICRKLDEREVLKIEKWFIIHKPTRFGCLISLIRALTGFSCEFNQKDRLSFNLVAIKPN